MLFIADLVKAMGMIVGVSSSLRLTVIAVALSSLFAGVLALPAHPESPNLSLVQGNTSSLQVPPYPRPPEEPACPSNEVWGATLGRPSYKDCDYILSNLYPKDPLAKPVMRNFYTAPADASHEISNFKLPYEQSHKTCSIQLLLATNFNDVPHDEATWNDLRGAARTIFRSCVLGKGIGGLVTKNGKLGNIEVIVYGGNSIYAKNQILKNSPDSLARSIATQELLELMKVVPGPSGTGLSIGRAANETSPKESATADAPTDTA